MRLSKMHLILHLVLCFWLVEGIRVPVWPTNNQKLQNQTNSPTNHQPHVHRHFGQESATSRPSFHQLKANNTVNTRGQSSHQYLADLKKTHIPRDDFKAISTNPFKSSGKAFGAPLSYPTLGSTPTVGNAKIVGNSPIVGNTPTAGKNKFIGNSQSLGRYPTKSGWNLMQNPFEEQPESEWKPIIKPSFHQKHVLQVESKNNQKVHEDVFSPNQKRRRRIPAKTKESSISSIAPSRHLNEPLRNEERAEFHEEEPKFKVPPIPKSVHESPRPIPTRPNYPGLGQWAVKGVKHKPFVGHQPYKIKEEEDEDQDFQRPEGYQTFLDNQKLFHNQKVKFESEFPAFEELIEGERQSGTRLSNLETGTTSGKSNLGTNVTPRKKFTKPKTQSLPQEPPGESGDESEDNSESGILDFTPVKVYSQVRKTKEEQHLPSDQTDPRLREVIEKKTSRIVYTEEGYEDSAYDHAGREKEAETSEGESQSEGFHRESPHTYHNRPPKDYRHRPSVKKKKSSRFKLEDELDAAKIVEDQLKRNEENKSHEENDKSQDKNGKEELSGNQRDKQGGRTEDSQSAFSEYEPSKVFEPIFNNHFSQTKEFRRTEMKTMPNGSIEMEITSEVKSITKPKKGVTKYVKITPKASTIYLEPTERSTTAIPKKKTNHELFLDEEGLASIKLRRKRSSDYPLVSSPDPSSISPPDLSSISSPDPPSISSPDPSSISSGKHGRRKRYTIDHPTIQVDTSFIDQISKDNHFFKPSPLPSKEAQEEKYPYYKDANLPKNSPLRFAENLKNIPVKKFGEMTFYEEMKKRKMCPEIPQNVNPIPQDVENNHDENKDEDNSGEVNSSKIISSEENRRKRDVNQDGTKKEENDKPRETGPRLNNLGDKIDCLKIRYFGENPLDSPFFKEEIIEALEPIFKIPLETRKSLARIVKADTYQDEIDESRNLTEEENDEESHKIEALVKAPSVAFRVQKMLKVPSRDMPKISDTIIRTSPQKKSHEEFKEDQQDGGKSGGSDNQAGETEETPIHGYQRGNHDDGNETEEHDGENERGNYYGDEEEQEDYYDEARIYYDDEERKYHDHDQIEGDIEPKKDRESKNIQIDKKVERNNEEERDIGNKTVGTKVSEMGPGESKKPREEIPTLIEVNNSTKDDLEEDSEKGDKSTSNEEEETGDTPEAQALILRRRMKPRPMRLPPYQIFDISKHLPRVPSIPIQKLPPLQKTPGVSTFHKSPGGSTHPKSPGGSNNPKSSLGFTHPKSPGGSTILKPAVLPTLKTHEQPPPYPDQAIEGSAPSPKYETISEVHYKDEIKPNEQLTVFADIINNIRNSSLYTESSSTPPPDPISVKLNVEKSNRRTRIPSPQAEDKRFPSEDSNDEDVVFVTPHPVRRPSVKKPSRKNPPLKNPASNSKNHQWDSQRDSQWNPHWNPQLDSSSSLDSSQKHPSWKDSLKHHSWEDTSLASSGRHPPSWEVASKEPAGRHPPWEGHQEIPQRPPKRPSGKRPPPKRVILRRPPTKVSDANQKTNEDLYEEFLAKLKAEETPDDMEQIQSIFKKNQHNNDQVYHKTQQKLVPKRKKKPQSAVGHQSGQGFTGHRHHSNFGGSSQYGLDQYAQENPLSQFEDDDSFQTHQKDGFLSSGSYQSHSKDGFVPSSSYQNIGEAEDVQPASSNKKKKKRRPVIKSEETQDVPVYTRPFQPVESSHPDAEVIVMMPRPRPQKPRPIHIGKPQFHDGQWSHGTMGFGGSYQYILPNGPAPTRTQDQSHVRIIKPYKPGSRPSRPGGHRPYAVIMSKSGIEESEDENLNPSEDPLNKEESDGKNIQFTERDAIAFGGQNANENNGEAVNINKGEEVREEVAERSPGEVNDYPVLGMRPPSTKKVVPYNHYELLQPNTAFLQRRTDSNHRSKRSATSHLGLSRRRRSPNKPAYLEISRNGNRGATPLEDTEDDEEYVPHRPRNWHYDEVKKAIVYDKKPEYEEEEEWVEVEVEEDPRPVSINAKKNKKKEEATTAAPPLIDFSIDRSKDFNYLEFVKKLKSDPGYAVIEDPKPTEKPEPGAASTTESSPNDSSSSLSSTTPPAFLSILAKVKSNSKYKFIEDPEDKKKSGKKSNETAEEVVEDDEAEEDDEDDDEKEERPRIVQNAPGGSGDQPFQIFDISEYLPSVHPKTSVDTSKYKVIERTNTRHSLSSRYNAEADLGDGPARAALVEEEVKNTPTDRMDGPREENPHKTEEDRRRDSFLRRHGLQDGGTLSFGDSFHSGSSYDEDNESKKEENVLRDDADEEDLRRNAFLARHGLLDDSSKTAQTNSESNSSSNSSKKKSEKVDHTSRRQNPSRHATGSEDTITPRPEKEEREEDIGRKPFVSRRRPQKPTTVTTAPRTTTPRPQTTTAKIVLQRRRLPTKRGQVVKGGEGDQLNNPRGRNEDRLKNHNMEADQKEATEKQGNVTPATSVQQSGEVSTRRVLVRGQRRKPTTLRPSVRTTRRTPEDSEAHHSNLHHNVVEESTMEKGHSKRVYPRRQRVRIRSTTEAGIERDNEREIKIESDNEEEINGEGDKEQVTKRRLQRRHQSEKDLPYDQRIPTNHKSVYSPLADSKELSFVVTPRSITADILASGSVPSRVTLAKEGPKDLREDVEVFGKFDEEKKHGGNYHREYEGKIGNSLRAGKSLEDEVNGVVLAETRQVKTELDDDVDIFGLDGKPNDEDFRIGEQAKEVSASSGPFQEGATKGTLGEKLEGKASEGREQETSGVNAREKTHSTLEETSDEMVQENEEKLREKSEEEVQKETSEEKVQKKTSEENVQENISGDQLQENTPENISGETTQVENTTKEKVLNGKPTSKEIIPEETSKDVKLIEEKVTEERTRQGTIKEDTKEENIEWNTTTEKTRAEKVEEVKTAEDALGKKTREGEIQKVNEFQQQGDLYKEDSPRNLGEKKAEKITIKEENSKVGIPEGVESTTRSSISRRRRPQAQRSSRPVAEEQITSRPVPEVERTLRPVAGVQRTLRPVAEVQRTPRPVPQVRRTSRPVRTQRRRLPQRNEIKNEEQKDSTTKSNGERTVDKDLSVNNIQKPVESTTRRTLRRRIPIRRGRKEENIEKPKESIGTRRLSSSTEVDSPGTKPRSKVIKDDYTAKVVTRSEERSDGDPKRGNVATSTISRRTKTVNKEFIIEEFGDVENHDETPESSSQNSSGSNETPESSNETPDSSNETPESSNETSESSDGAPEFSDKTAASSHVERVKDEEKAETRADFDDADGSEDEVKIRFGRRGRVKEQRGLRKQEGSLGLGGTVGEERAFRKKPVIIKDPSKRLYFYAPV